MNEPTLCPRCGATIEPWSPEGLCPQCVLAAGFVSQTEAEPAPATVPIPTPADLSAFFPQLDILDRLGRGGMGWVYEARQRNLDRKVALKVLPPDVGGDPAFAERFLREARALARLNHPNIIAIYDFGQAGPYYYFVMEFVDGANLRQLERARRLSPEEAFAIVPKICEALQFAHDEGIVHRDIKPENILVDSKGRVKIADFGIAKIVGKEQDIALTGTLHTLGTLHYMAPEQIEAPANVDHRADIYALGVVFYEMLTGELPMGRFEPPSKKLEVDVRVDEVVLKSLERNPERRYQTAGAVKTDVETIARSESSPDTALREAAASTPVLTTKGRVDAPAFCLLVNVLLNWVTIWVFSLVALNHSTLYTALLGTVVGINALAMFGAVEMLRRRSLKAAMMAGLAVMAVSLILAFAMPALFWVWIGLPVGVWVLTALFNPEARSEFHKPARRSSPEASKEKPPLARVLDALVLLLVPLAFLALRGGFDRWIPFEGAVFDAVKAGSFSGCLGLLFWYFWARKPVPVESHPERSASPPKSAAQPADAGAFSIVGRAWHDWWAERAKWFAITVQGLLVAAHLFCLIAFFSTSIKSAWNDEGVRQFTFAAGAGDPWFRYETYPAPNTPFRSGFNLLSGSMLFLAAGFVLYYVVWRIEKVRKPKAGFWSSPAAMAALWAIWAACVVGLGTTLGHNALKDNLAGGGFHAPQLRIALKMRDADERDDALRNVALQAAPTGELETLTRAIKNILSGELRDQTAAQCAFALAKLKGGSEMAVEAAGLIETESLREEALAKLAIEESAKGSEPDQARAPRDALVDSAARGDISRVIEVLDGGVSVNDKNASGQTALTQAVANGHRSLALTLILLGADITEKDQNGMTAVMHAVVNRDQIFLSAMRQLWEVSYDQNSEKRKETLRALPGIDRALLKDREFDLVRFSVWHDSLEQTDDNGETPSLMAARAGDWEIYRIVAPTLLSLRARDQDGRTAVMHFAMTGSATPFENLDQSHLFGKAGPENGFVGAMVPFDVDQLALVDKDGKTALQLAHDHGQAEIAGILSRHLETLVANQTAALESIRNGGMTAALRKRYEIRSLAWQALGEREKALEDFRKSKRPAESEPEG